MPRYDVKCEACDTVFTDVFAKMGQLANVKCPDCDGPTVNATRTGMRLIGVTPTRPFAASGYTLESNQAVELLEKSGHIVESKDSTWMKDTKQKLMDSADKKAKKNGFRDFKEAIADAKKLKASQDKQSPPSS